MDINEIADRLFNSVQTLNEQRELLQAELRQHEEHINNLHMGIETGIQVPNGAILGYGRVPTIVKNKRKEVWGFYYRENKQSPMCSIYEAPLLAQHAMTLHMHYLVRALVKEARITTKQLKKATATVREFLNAMGIDENGKVKV